MLSLKEKQLTLPIFSGIVPHFRLSFANSYIAGLWYYDWLNVFSALAFGVVILKFELILELREWYQTTRIQNVAILETLSALIFVAIVLISPLPTHLSKL